MRGGVWVKKPVERGIYVEFVFYYEVEDKIVALAFFYFLFLFFFTLNSGRRGGVGKKEKHQVGKNTLNLGPLLLIASAPPLRLFSLTDERINKPSG